MPHSTSEQALREAHMFIRVTLWRRVFPRSVENPVEILDYDLWYFGVPHLGYMLEARPSSEGRRQVPRPAGHPRSGFERRLPRSGLYPMGRVRPVEGDHDVVGGGLLAPDDEFTGDETRRDVATERSPDPAEETAIHVEREARRPE